MMDAKIVTAEEVKVQIETLQGPQGERGAQGPQGERGERGPQGIQGPAGARGEKGDRGERGEKGATGERGPQGLPGRDGADGRDGAAGARGPQGAQGLQGERGEPGPAGRDGVDGIQGFSPIVDLERLDDGVLITVQNKDGNKIARVFDGKNAENKLEDIFIIHFNEYVNASQEPIEEIINAIDAGKVVIGVTPSGVIYEYAGLKTYINKASETAHTFQTHIDPFNRNAVSRFTQIKTDNSDFISSGQDISAKNPYKLILSGAVKAEYDGSKQVNITIPEGGEGSGGLPEGGEPHQMLVTDADGNAKWEERTHYAEVKEMALYENYALTNTEEGMYVALTPYSVEPVIGDTYTIVIKNQGTEQSNDYVAKEFLMEGMTLTSFGNAGLFGGEDTGESFLLLFVPVDMAASLGTYAMCVYPTAGTTDVELTVSGIVEEVHKIDKKYIPNIGASNLVNGTGLGSVRNAWMPDYDIGDSSFSWMGEATADGSFAVQGKASGQWSFCHGEEASGDYSFAANSAKATGYLSFAANAGEASQNTSFAACQGKASGMWASAFGRETVAIGRCQHVVGEYNAEVSNALFIVGNGDSDTNRKNVHTLSRLGDGWYSGSLYVGGTSQDNASKVLTEADIDSIADAVIAKIPSAEGVGF